MITYEVELDLFKTLILRLKLRWTRLDPQTIFLCDKIVILVSMEKSPLLDHNTMTLGNIFRQMHGYSFEKGFIYDKFLINLLIENMKIMHFSTVESLVFAVYQFSLCFPLGHHAGDRHDFTCSRHYKFT